MDGALAGAAHVVTETFQTQWIEHAFLEPESALAYPDGDGGLHFYTQGQGIWSDRRQVAGLLGLPEDKVRATLVSNGGAFGAKEDLNVQGHAALLAWRYRAPGQAHAEPRGKLALPRQAPPAHHDLHGRLRRARDACSACEPGS